jgi:Na+/H+ antiporter
MENYSVVIFILAILIGLAAIADKIRIPYPILLIIAGMTIGFVPALPEIRLNPEVIFLLFLPPMLYDAAFNISFKEFKININTIGTLSISLVFITVVGIALIAHYCIPGMTWPLSFVLGAILSATDAVAAMSVTKGLGLSHKTMTILEGESLINDASALVAYRLAVAAVTGSVFILWKASLDFAILLVGGLLVGTFIAKTLAFFLQKVQHNALVVISLMLLMPFVTYLFAEELHVSGVIAVVTLGLIISRFSSMVFPDSLKQESKTIWDIIVFLLNGLVFILIGLEFPHVVKSIDAVHLWPYIGYAFLIWIGTLLLRTGRIFMQQANLQQAFLKQKRRISAHALLDFKNSLIISWSGMRGIVSLAIAIGLPTTLSDGSPFPQRDAIVFISVVVVLFTLIGQGLTLPLLIKWLKVDSSEVKA